MSHRTKRDKTYENLIVVSSGILIEMLLHRLKDALGKLKLVDISWTQKDFAETKRKVVDIICDIDNIVINLPAQNKDLRHLLQDISKSLLVTVDILERNIQAVGSCPRVTSIDDEGDRFDLPSTLKVQITFDDIVGNVSAKRALFESIVLRFSLNENLKRTVFVGPRKLSSNILLYGPPGCGNLISSFIV